MLPYIIFVRVGAFIFPGRYFYEYEGDQFLLNQFYELFDQPFLQIFTGIILLFIQATYVNRISIKNRIDNEITLFPGIIFILLSSLSPALCQLSPIMLANTFILVMISQMFKTYRKPGAPINIFNAGFFASIATVLYPPYLLIILFGFAGFMILRSFKVLEQLQYIIGYGVFLYLLYSSYYYFQIELNFVKDTFTSALGLVKWEPLDNVGIIVTLGMYLMIFMLVFFSYNKYTIKKSIASQKKVDLLYWLMAFGMIITLFSANVGIYGLLIITCSLSILFAMTLSAMKSNLSTELVHLFFLAVIGIIHFVVT